MREADGIRGFEAEYAQGRRRNSADSLDFSAASLGQNCSPCCPQHCPHPDEPEIQAFSESLGAPLSIIEVAHLIGVSAWTVRHRYLSAGLPYVRVGPAGKLIFYTNQVVRWLLWQQQKGGTNP